MARQRHLRNAPITEALIDFRVSQLGKPLNEASLDLLKPGLQERYPTWQRQDFVEARIEVKGPSIRQDATDKQFRGFLFRARDERSIAQFRVDGFTYNRLKPYPSWEDILPEAISLWRLYVETAAPVLVTRTAVRYINHLRLPFPERGLIQYLAAPPVAPEGYPRFLSGFLTRVTLHEPEEGLAAIVTQASEQGLEAAHLTIILDIDAFSDMEFIPGSDRLLSMLERLRALKNGIFFGSLTEDAVRLFE